ncbi:LacI family transcriptional regulator [Rhizocola hellebori]|uniref:LacI family transcriptional regulator n=1 Tax=Rhizocola hellebori TaxID=1392758 RepID=A0A8J3Q7A4_9ACTN|nr:LacI family DNA-binding transcriptional regulator [Rhizocola hellebori]GIH04729.1 LacI family transcriptional regulator [Rhizocola hellebori]
MPRKPVEQADGERRSTIRDVAALAGVSVATVSRVLAGNYPIAPPTRARVLRAVKDLDYVVNVHARALAGVSQKTVAILTRDVTTPFYAHVIQGVEQQAAQDGRLCVVCTTGADPDRELAYVKMMREHGADAVIIVGGVVETLGYRKQLAQYAQALDSAGSKLVLCGRPGLGPDVPALVAHYDNEGGAYAATSHVLSAGHERVLFLGGVEGFTTSDPRVAGWRRALRDRGITPDKELLQQGSFGTHFGYERTRQLLKRGPLPATAIVASDDGCAAGAVRALREAGLGIPEDVSVVGYDDAPMAAHLWPPLTTVHIPAEELGRTAVRLALDSRAQLGRETILGTHVVVRDSVARRIDR